MKVTKLLTLTLLLSISFLACDEETIIAEPSGTSSVTFASKQQAVAENSGEALVTISLNTPAFSNGSIVIKVDTALAKYFTTEPSTVLGTMALDVTKGATSASFKVKANDNNVADGNRLVVFRIAELSQGLLPGLQTFFTLTINDNEERVIDSYATFVQSGNSLVENVSDGQAIQIQLSESLTANGSLTVEVQSDAVYNRDYATEPALTDNKLQIAVQPGTGVVSFRIIPIDNAIISGNFQVTFQITSTTGNIKKGTTVSKILNITDDELAGMPMGYESGGGGWGMKRSYEYNVKGNVSKVIWETRTPFLTSGIDTYYYDADDRLVRINTGTNQDTKFQWDNDRITKQEKFQNGVLKSYTEYGYDDHGNIGTYRTFYLQPDHSYAQSDITVLLYHLDGNLYKKIVYYPTSNPEEELIISESTFETYLDAENPFPMVEVLPTVRTQSKLPQSFRLKAGGQDLLYHMTYEFLPDGKVGRRSVTLNGGIADNVVYKYY